MIFAERFEVGAADDAEFNEWLEGPHLEAVAALPDVLRVRAFRQHRDVPERFPYDRYMSKGNRMILAEFPMKTSPLDLARRDVFRDVLRESAAWDLRLPYVRRELAVNHVLRDKADAAATLEARRAQAQDT